MIFKRMLPMLLSLPLVLATPLPARAQEYVVDLSQLDPGALLAGAGDVLRRAPDGDIDALFQATHAAAQVPEDKRILCTLFDPSADRGFDALASTANRLGRDSRQRFGVALAGIAANGLQGQRQPYDESAARQTLKQAGVVAMLLHDGFVLGMTAQGSDPASRDARCRSFGWMLDALQDVPRPQRVAATRLMLSDGLGQLAPR